MIFKELIEKAEKAAGSQKELALKIGQTPSALRSAKCGNIGLPIYACIMIADLIEIDRIEVIKASELVTEKKEERRQFWQGLA
jgi:ribosome-binding protein aMBF1 (putative translation factor)